MRRLWGWLVWMSLPARQRREIEALETDEAAIRVIRARIEADMVEMGMEPSGEYVRRRLAAIWEAGR